MHDQQDSARRLFCAAKLFPSDVLAGTVLPSLEPACFGDSVEDLPGTPPGVVDEASLAQEHEGQVKHNIGQRQQLDHAEDCPGSFPSGIERKPLNPHNWRGTNPEHFLKPGGKHGKQRTFHAFPASSGTAFTIVRRCCFSGFTSVGGEDADALFGRFFRVAMASSLSR